MSITDGADLAAAVAKMNHDQTATEANQIDLTNRIDQQIRELLPPNSMGNFFSYVLLQVQLAVSTLRELPSASVEKTDRLNRAAQLFREAFRECLVCANSPHALASVINILRLYDEYPESIGKGEPKVWGSAILAQSDVGAGKDKTGESTFLGHSRLMAAWPASLPISALLPARASGAVASVSY